MVDLHETLVRGGGQALFGMDDGYLQGNPSVLFPALERFSNQIKEHCGLLLEPSKCEVYTLRGCLPSQAPPSFTVSRVRVEESPELRSQDW